MLPGSISENPTIIGSDEYVTVNELVDTVAGVAGKEIHKDHVEGAVGVQARNFKATRSFAQVQDQIIGLGGGHVA